MECQDCKKQEATVHLTQIVNNEKTSLSLCKDCAAARGFHSPLDNVPFPLAEILSSMAAKMPIGKMDAANDLICSGCGLSFEQFTRQGRFGCGQCYRTFRANIEPIMRKIHGASLHRGKTPELQTQTGVELDTPRPIVEEERLRGALKEAIESEDFERAAELRDKLRAIKEVEPVDHL